MRLIVMGCGRMGAQVSRLMVNEGHDVTVIDQDPVALARLGPEFRGRTVLGIGFDQDVLKRAGIEDAGGFAAVSSSDKANIVSARIARHLFHVPSVVARLYDPRRAEIYRRLGLSTFSSTTWGAEKIRELLTHAELDPVYSLGSGEVSLFSLEVPPMLVGHDVRQLTVTGEISVSGITRQGRAFIPLLGTEFQAGDTLHMFVSAAAMHRFQEMIGLGEGG